MKSRVWSEPGERNDRNLDADERKDIEPANDEQKEVRNGNHRSDIRRTAKS